MLEKPKLELSKKEIKKLPRNFFTNVIAFMNTQQLMTVILFFMKDEVYMHLKESNVLTTLT